MPTPTEELLSRICRHSFLSLWSHPHVHRDTVPVPHELCDVLVVFGNDIVIFSDKSIAYRTTPDPLVSWRRWFRKAVLDSSKQLHGAARWLQEHPNRVFLDPQCTQRLPSPIPTRDRATKTDANRASYLWDRLIEHLIEGLEKNSRPANGAGEMMTRESALRVMAAENRFTRRLLANKLAGIRELSRNLAPNESRVRIGFIKERPEIAYVFYLLEPDPSISRQQYIHMRLQALADYCEILCVELPEAKTVIGLGMFPPSYADPDITLCCVINENRRR